MAADLPVGRPTKIGLLLIAYCAPAVVVWAVLGAVLNIVPAPRLALMIAVLYGGYYGLVEVLGGRGLRAPGRRWQVPSHWVGQVSRWRRVAVWGTLLGPGFATRNPYAGFGLLPVVVAAAGSLRSGIVLAALLGLLHGLFRALALLRDTRNIASFDYMNSIKKSMYWRTADGMALLGASGLALSALIIGT